MEERNKTLGEFIIEHQNSFQYSTGELSRIINSIRLAAKVVNYKVNKAGLVDIVGAAGEQNIQGEDQQKLDVYANEVFIQTLINREIVCGIGSEENDDFITVAGSDNSHNNKYPKGYSFERSSIFEISGFICNDLNRHLTLSSFKNPSQFEFNK
jgi:fructose-1,6-bisphosphatase I